MPKKEKPKYVPSIVQAKELLGNQSRVPNARTGTVKEYGDARNVGLRVFSSKEHFDVVDSQFREVKDLEGNSLLEIARRYWDDPEFAEKQRQEIAERKRRGR